MRRSKRLQRSWPIATLKASRSPPRTAGSWACCCEPMSTGTSRRKNEGSPEPRGTGSCLVWPRSSAAQLMTQLAPAVNYWFMLPACVIIAGVAVFCGISGATMLLPLFFVLFPLFGVPALTVPQAVGAALVLQVAAFGLAVYRYARCGLVRWDIVGSVAVISVPAAILGAVVAHVPVRVFRLLFAAGLVAIAPVLLRRRSPVPEGSGARLSLGQLGL